MMPIRARAAALANRPLHPVEDEFAGDDEGEEVDDIGVVDQSIRPREVDIFQVPQDRDRQVEDLEIRHETLSGDDAGGATGGDIVQDRGADGGLCRDSQLDLI